MMYRHAGRDNFEDFAAGRVLLHAPGLSHFPVRLACEVFARCLERFPPERKIRLYDPCCGSGYMLAVLGFHFSERIGSLSGSDIDPEAIRLARLNMSLLSEQGLAARMKKLRSMLDAFGKESHKGAIESAGRLLGKVRAFTDPMQISIFQADLLDSEDNSRSFSDGFIADIVFADVPHGRLVEWMGTGKAESSWMDALLDSVAPIMAPDGLVVLAGDKGQRMTHPGWQRLEKIMAGKRRIEILGRASDKPFPNANG
jgi:23S rRNA (guanine2535-N1)-methyltransferase